jgi:hypothetical protein
MKTPSAFFSPAIGFLTSAFLLMPSLLCGAPADAPGSIRFNRDIRPILSDNCFYCHGQDANKRKAGLRLDVREAAIQTLESGEKAIVPGKPEASGIITRIFSTAEDEQMPPPKSHRFLTAPQKELLKRWVVEGAAYETHWAFSKPTRPALPSAANSPWVKNGIDHFILAKLRESGLNPSAEADKPTLIRRLSLDLTGLPPTPEEVDAFVADTAPDAYEKLVDRLMASPHYGERMALPWLDAARYADSNGFQQDGDTFQWVWRDWVVRALNTDMPFNQFSIEQLAGDLLPNATNEQLVATAFNRNHLLNGEGGAIAEEQRFNILFDRVDTTSTVWLGLTMACAQCHDHKYDPITMRDYYGLLDSFNRVSENGLAGGGPGPKRIASPFLELRTAEHQAKLQEWEAQRKEIEKEGRLTEKQELAFAAWMQAATPDTPNPKTPSKKLPETVITILKIESGKRTADQNKQLQKEMRRIFDEDLWPKISGVDESAKKFLELKNQSDRLVREEIPRVMVMRDDRKRETFLLDRGEYLKPKEKVEFATPAFLPAPPAGGPRNRLGFAQWLFQPDHPLTARVQINRIWQTLFGTGLVKTAEDLGVQSEMPVHLDLLNWLGAEFEERGWSQKHMVRLIVTSATYRQTSRVTPQLLQKDPENRLLSRGARFRASSLILRDIALAASGLLDRSIGGKPVYPYQPEGIWEALAITKERDFSYPASSGSDLYRRSLYTFWRRTVSPANMFDASSRQVCKVRQSATNTPLHALTTLNDPTWAEAARILAQRAFESSPDTDARLRHAFRRVLGKAPETGQLEALRRMLENQRSFFRNDAKAAEAVVSIGSAPRNNKLDSAEHAALSAVCLGILNLDQALTRE